MPTYTYRCQKCGHEFERFQSMSDEPVKRCELCRGKVQRVFHPVGIVLKGPGFHKTDYRSSKRSGGGESTSSESKAESKKKESKPSDASSSGTKSSSEGSKASSSDG